RPFPITGDRWLVARGNSPIWSSDGKEVLFNTNPGRGLEAVSVTTQPSFAVGNPRLIEASGKLNLRGPRSVREVTMAPDGRFVGVAAGQQATDGAGAASQIQVVLNWFEELKRLVPTK